MMARRIEAVQFRVYGQWHAVLAGSDVTACGRDAIKAERMYERWDERESDEQCARCVVVLHRRKGV